LTTMGWFQLDTYASPLTEFQLRAEFYPLPRLGSRARIKVVCSKRFNWLSLIVIKDGYFSS